jgi:signal transduction histidine kinase
MFCLIFFFFAPLKNEMFNLNIFNSFLYYISIIIALEAVFRKQFRAIIYLISVIPVHFMSLTLIFKLNALEIVNQIENFNLYLFTYFAPVFEFVLLGLALIIKLNADSKNLQLRLNHSKKELILTQEAERKIIAQDLHDDLGATLSVLKGRNKQEDFSEETQNLLNKAIADLRSISRRLLPADFEMFGFIPSIEKYVFEVNQQQKIKVTFIVFGEIVKLNNEKELNIYRIISELVNNSTKYSNGQNATVQLIYHEDYVFVSVEDDGQVENKNENNLGIGLKNVISRLEYLNAIIIEKGGANGYSFIFEIPYKPNL